MFDTKLVRFIHILQRHNVYIFLTIECIFLFKYKYKINLLLSKTREYVR